MSHAALETMTAEEIRAAIARMKADLPRFESELARRDEDWRDTLRKIREGKI